MLGQLSSRDDDLSTTHIVVGEEYDLEKVTNLRIIVYFLRHTVDKFDDGLGIMVARSSLTTNHDNSRHELVLPLVSWSIEDGQVSVDDIKNVHELSLVFVNSFDLHII